MGQVMSHADAIRQIGGVAQTHYLWRKAYGGMRLDQLKELTDLFIVRGAPKFIRPTTARVRFSGCSGLDHCGWRKESVYRARITLRE